MPHGSHYQACNCLPSGWLCLVPAPLRIGLLTPLLGGSHVEPLGSAISVSRPQQPEASHRMVPGMLDMALARIRLGSSHQSHREVKARDLLVLLYRCGVLLHTALPPETQGKGVPSWTLL